MEYADDTPFFRLLATKYVPEREAEALVILETHPDVARLEWPGPDERGQPFVRGSTALHYAANDGKLHLVQKLIAYGADVNASHANWYRSVLAWAANNARLEVLHLLLATGALPTSLDALHAAAWGGPHRGAGREEEFVATIRLLVEAGANVNDRRYPTNQTPLAVALASGNQGVVDYLRSIGAES